MACVAVGPCFSENLALPEEGKEAERAKDRERVAKQRRELLEEMDQLCSGVDTTEEELMERLDRFKAFPFVQAHKKLSDALLLFYVNPSVPHHT